MESAGGTERWFTENELVALRDYWTIYEQRYQELQQTSFAWAQAHPTLGPALAGVSIEESERQGAISRQLIRDAIASGDFTLYAQHSRPQGAFYATLGVRFRDWFDFISWFGRTMLLHLESAFVEDTSRLIRAVDAMQKFLHRTMVVLGETYIETKEAALCDSEQRFRLLIESVADYAIYTIDADGKVATWTSGAERMKQYQSKMVIGQHFSRFFAVADPDQHCRSLLAQAVSHGRAENAGWHLRMDGSRYWCHSVISPMRDEKERLVGFVCVNQDRTEARQKEEALRQSEGTLAATLSAIQEGVVIVGSDGAILYRNPAAQAMTRSTAQAIGETKGICYADGTDCPLEQTPIARALRGETCQNIELMVRLPHKPAGLYVSASGAPIRSPDGALLGAVCSFHDISLENELKAQRAQAAEFRQQTQRFQEASRLKSEFLTNMSHELRTPLNAIIGFAELLYNGAVPTDSPDHHEFLGDILTSGRHLLQLINDVLDLAKVEAGKMNFHPEPFDLSQPVAEVLSILRPALASKRIEVSASIDPEIGIVNIDPRRFKQVLYNYLSNAQKFTPERGRVEVRLLADGPSHFRLEVEDSGIGISEVDQKRLFIDFHQLDGGAPKKHPGTGLGLALTRRLVEAQNGSVAVLSSPGKGSRFSARLPRHMAPVEHQVLKRPAAGPTTGPRILVVEDDTRERAELLTLLLQAGYTVDAAASGAEASALVEGRPYEAVVLDLLLPDLRSEEVLRAIRGTQQNPNVPVIVVTRDAGSGELIGGTVFDILPKPIEPAVLLHTLDRARGYERAAGGVMVVDDDPISQRLVEAALVNAGYAVSCFGNAVSALAACKQRQPDAVVLDLLMPGMSGFEFLERFRGEPENLSVPVIVWTVKDLSLDELAKLRVQAQAVNQKGRGSRALMEELVAVLATGRTQLEGSL